jgi:hypothetical protein
MMKMEGGLGREGGGFSIELYDDVTRKKHAW